MTRRTPAVLLVLAGCAAPPAERNNLSGKLTLDGRPLTDGIVTLVGANGQDATSSILADGTYSVDDPPLGTCEVTVRDAPRGGPMAHGESADRPARIPSKYQKPGNGLKVDVRPGRAVYDIHLSS